MTGALDNMQVVVGIALEHNNITLSEAADLLESARQQDINNAEIYGTQQEEAVFGV